MAVRTGMPVFSPAAATSCGEGVSPAARAAARGSPPGQRRRDHQGRGWPVLRFGLKAVQDGALHHRIDIAHQRGRVSGRAIATQAHNLFQRLAVEGGLAGEQFVEHQAERIDVAARR